jgi:hypothetical protein
MGVIVADDNFAIINLIKDIETARNYLYSKQLQVSVSVTEEAPQEFSEQQYASVFPRKKKEKCKQEKFKISPRGRKEDQEDLGLHIQVSGDKKIPLNLNKRKNKEKMTVKGLIWNCRGIRKKGVSTFPRNLICEHQFHFIGLPETMVESCEDSSLRKFDCNQDYLWMWNSSRGKSGGILVGVRSEWYDVGSFKQGEFMLQLNLWDKLNKTKWNLLIVYGAAQDENKTAMLAELSSFCSINTEPILIGGDFNIIRFAKEKIQWMVLIGILLCSIL